MDKFKRSMRITNYEEIIDYTIIQGKMVIDDHNNEKIKLLGVAYLSNGYTVALLDSICYALNELYIDTKGEVHLSKKSVGGVIVKQDIERYNFECKNKIEEFRIFN